MYYSQSIGCDAWLAAWLARHALVAPECRKVLAALVLDIRLDLDFQYLVSCSASNCFDFEMKSDQHSASTRLNDFGSIILQSCPHSRVASEPTDLQWS